MSAANQYYDSNIYMQSANLIIRVAHMYYYEGKRQQEISEELEISVPTVSRLLKKAKEQKIVRFSIAEEYLECLKLERWLQEHFHLSGVIVAPVPGEKEPTNEELKKFVALEGARYLQRTVSDNDILGVAYGDICSK
jgi:deoxyribonucleoside regulator